MTHDMMIQYLKRIDCMDAEPVSVSNLSRLQRQHLIHIPYENIDIFSNRGKSVSPLDINYLFQKIVLRHRGGYCFELNGLFADLLRGLGYKVVELFARWHYGQTNPVPKRRHRIILADLNGEFFLVDAGVGCQCPLEPLRFQEKVEQPRNGRVYKVLSDDMLGYVVCVFDENEWVPFYSFSLDAQYPQDFFYAHYFCSTSENSPFVNHLYVHRFYSDESRISLIPEAGPNGITFCTIRKYTNDGQFSTVLPVGSVQMSEALEKNFDLRNVPEISFI